MISPRAASGLAVAALAVSLGWLALLVAAPPALARPGTARDLAAWTYRAGARLCHQRPDRSFSWQGRALPVCARCAGLYLGVPVGVALALAGRASPHAARHGFRRRAVLLAAAPTLASVVAEASGFATVGPLGRATLGAGLGAVAAWAGIGALRDEAATPGAVN